MFKPYQKVIDYFSSLESKLGYDLILGGVKHFGYYPSSKMDIPEKKAQTLTMDLVAKKLSLNSKDTILEAGCGQGYTTTYLAKKYGCKAIGITITPFEVEKATIVAKKRGIADKVKFYQMDYAKTNFPDNYFSVIYTLESFVHAYDMKKTLKELKRILKPGGRIVFFEYSIATDKEIGDFMNREKQFQTKSVFDNTIDTGAMFNLRNLRHDIFPKILKSMGFIKIHEENITKNMLPSMQRLNNLACFPYMLVKLLHLKKFFFNTWVAAEFFPILLQYPEADLLRYNITIAQKP